jgi:hypothetical protein
VPAISKKIFDIAFYLFPNLSLFDVKLQAAHGIPVPLSYTVWVTLYGISYGCLSIMLAALLFRKKEF